MSFGDEHGCELGFWLVAMQWLDQRYPRRRASAVQMSELTQRLGEVARLYERFELTAKPTATLAFMPREARPLDGAHAASDYDDPRDEECDG